MEELAGGMRTSQSLYTNFFLNNNQIGKICASRSNNALIVYNSAALQRNQNCGASIDSDVYSFRLDYLRSAATQIPQMLFLCNISMSSYAANSSRR